MLRLVFRATLDGKHPGGWVPHERISLEEALRAYTVDAAYASFEESKKGMLREGMLADFVLIDRDIFAEDPQHIRDCAVQATVVGGRVAFERSHD